MISIKEINKEFLFRVAGVLVQDKKVLLQRNKKGDAWVFPGGRAEINEDTGNCVVREFREELGVCVRVDRLLWIIENFNAYEYKDLHEFGMYYSVKLDGYESWDAKIHLEEFLGIEEAVKLTFRWFKIEELDQILIYPKASRELLQQLHKTKEIVHIMNQDKEFES
jgi:8-oxo-dGTP pyrophosphatase MutT (NUDIX family)